MVKLIIFFRRPADVEAFEEHFANQHVPLITAMPNVVRSSVTRALGAPRGEPLFHIIHDVYFSDLPSLNYALNSPEGRAAGTDLMAFARDVVTLMFAEVWGEDPFELGVGAEPIPSEQALEQVTSAASNLAMEPTPEPDSTKAPIDVSLSEKPHESPIATPTDTPTLAEAEQDQHQPRPLPEEKPE